MHPLFPAIIAIALYLAASVLLLRQLREPLHGLRAILTLMLLALLAHGVSVYHQIFQQQTINLDFFKVASLIFWFMGVLALSSLARHKSIAALLLILLPLSSVAILISLFASSDYQGHTTMKYGPGILTHILSSILAYSVLTIASFQALGLALQERSLKRKRGQSLIEWFPPIQTMEKLLFEMLWVGIILLSISIASGALFLEDIFAQHLAHKTLFSITAWCLFAILLWGRHQLGWRGRTAVKWTLSGFVALMLAYFGSKFALEIVLSHT